MGGGFVGREAQLRALGDLARDRHHHGLQLALVSGEPGIGKTRLVREFTARLDEPTSWARCWDDRSVPPLWPWIQTLRGLLDRPEAVRLVDFFGGPPRSHDRVGAADELGLFEQVADSIRRAAGQRPLTLVIDDLHLADPGSLRLLRFLRLTLDDLPLLVICLLRTGGSAPVTGQLAAVREMASEITVGGLAAPEVRALVGEARYTRALQEASRGNPLHLRQALLRAGEDGGADPLLLELIRQRLAAAPANLRETLAAVAVLGRHADADSVSRTLDLPHDTLEGRLRELAAQGWLEPDSPTPVHPILSQVALESAAGEARRLHARAAAVVLERTATPGEVAHHLAAAGPEHRREAAAAHLAAASLAAESLDHEAAQHHHGAALEILRALPDCAEAAFDAAYGLAGATAAVAGPRAADPAYREALELARRLGDPRLAARAVARHDIEYYLDPDTVRPQLRLCHAALAGLAEEDSVERVLLLAQLGTGALAGIDVEQSKRHADEGVAMARRLGDPWALGRALVAQQVCDLGPATLSQRLETAAEIVSLASTAKAPELGIHGRFLLKCALLEAGRLQELDGLLPVQRAEIVSLGLARFRRHWQWFHAMRAMLEGDADTVEKLAMQCAEAADELGDPDGVGVLFGQLGVARWMQGRLGELEDAYLDRLHAEPHDPLWPGVLAWVALLTGREDAARGYLSRFVDPGQVPSTQHTLLTWLTMGDVVAALGTRDQAERHLEVLAPYAGRVVPIAMGAGVFGSISRVLGALAARVGDRPAALAHFQAAVDQTAQLPARPFLVDAQLWLADTLLDDDRATAADIERAGGLLAEAGIVARSHGLSVFATRLAGTAQRFEELRRRPAAPAGGPVVRVLGGFEVIGADGSPATWSSRRARRLLKLLVSRRGGLLRRDEVFEELWPGEDPAVLGNRFSVALRAVRRALDPQQQHSLGAFVTLSDQSLRLRIDVVRVDAETFLEAARLALASPAPAPESVSAALACWTGTAFGDEPDAAWARPLRDAVDLAARQLLTTRVTQCTLTGDWAQAAGRRRQLLELDPFDEQAHLGLVADLARVGSPAKAEEAWTTYLAAMSELGLAPAPDPRGD